MSESWDSVIADTLAEEAVKRLSLMSTEALRKLQNELDDELYRRKQGASND